MKLPAYQDYKKVNLSWLNHIPTHWKTKKLKFSTYVKGRIGWHGLNSDEFLYEGNYYLVTGTDFTSKRINWETCYRITEERYEENPYIHLMENDLLLTKDGSIGKLAIVKDIPYKASVNSGVFVTRPLNNDYDTNYMFYLLSSDLFKEFINYQKTGTTINHLYQEVFENFEYCYPPSIEEQHTIANFLDYKTSQIDELIEKKGQLLKLLEEKRIALITQAVTKGLDPSVKMKPSGIDWLGDIPKHWEVKRLRYVSKIQFSGVDKKTEEDESEVLLCNYIDVYKNEFIDKNIDFMKASASKREINKFTVEEGDVLVTKDSETPYDIAVPGLVIENFPNVLCGYHLTQIKPNKNVLLPSYLFRLFQSKNFNVHFIKSANGITRFGVGTNVFADALVPVFSKKEQQKIVDYIQINCDKINSLEKSIMEAIERLKEYRISLITSAVTGKIRVPTGDVKKYKTSKERKA